MKPIPPNAQIQKLIASHPHGVKGPPLAVAWSTHHPDTLVIIDTVGHKLIFENSPLPAGDGQGEGATPNKQGEKLPATTKKTGENQFQATNIKEPGFPKPTNKPKPVGARQASPKGKAKP